MASPALSLLRQAWAAAKDTAERHCSGNEMTVSLSYSLPTRLEYRHLQGLSHGSHNGCELSGLQLDVAGPQLDLLLFWDEGFHRVAHMCDPIIREDAAAGSTPCRMNPRGSNYTAVLLNEYNASFGSHVALRRSETVHTD